MAQGVTSKEQMAQLTGVAPSTAADDMRAIRDEVTFSQEYRQVRQEEHIVILQDHIRQLSIKFKRSQDPKDSAALVKALEREAKLIGLDAPQKRELTGKDGEPLNQPVFVEPPPEMWPEIMEMRMRAMEGMVVAGSLVAGDEADEFEQVA